MQRYLLGRFVQALITLVAVTFVVFALLRIVPGGPEVVLLPPRASNAEAAELRHALGLDRSLPEQYLVFLGNLVKGDLGTSYVYKQPVTTTLLPALLVTLEISAVGFVLGVAVALPFGMLSALRPSSKLGSALSFLVVAGQSVPTYWLGFVLIYVFAVNLHVLPTSGYGSPAHFVLPAITIVAWVAALIAGVTRESLIEVFRQPYITTARSKGLAERRILLIHAMRNALIQVSTVVALEFGYLLSGAVITEVVFGLPGLGSLGYAAILNRDYPIVQGIVLTAAVEIVFVSVLLDVAYIFLDPRIRYAGSKSS